MSKQSEDPSTSSRYKFHEVFQPKQARYSDIPPSKISEVLTSNSLDNAPTQSLLSVINGILDESIERKNGEIPDRVACLLRKVVQEIERRISTQAEHIRYQNNLFKTREEKYQTKIRMLEKFAVEVNNERQTERIFFDKRKKDENDMDMLMKEKEENDLIISKLKYELEQKNKTQEDYCFQLENLRQAIVKLMKEKKSADLMMAKLMEELEEKNKSDEQGDETNINNRKKHENELAEIMKNEGNDEIVSKLKYEDEKNNNAKKNDFDETMKDGKENDHIVSKLKCEPNMENKSKEYCPQLENMVEGATMELVKEKKYADLMVSKHMEELEMERILFDKRKKEEDDIVMLMKEKEENDLIIAKLKYELELNNKTQEEYCLQLENLKEATVKLLKEKESADLVVAKLMAELEEKNKTHEQGEKSHKTKINNRKKQEENDVTEVVEEVNCQIVSKLKCKHEKKNNAKENDFAEIMEDEEENDQTVSLLKCEHGIQNKTEYCPQLKKIVEEATMELMTAKNNAELMVTKLMDELELKNKSHEQQRLQFEAMVKETKYALVKQNENNDEMVKQLKEEIEMQNMPQKEQLMELQAQLLEAKNVLKEKETSNLTVEKLKEEAEIKYRLYEEQCLQLEENIKGKKEELKKEKLECSFAVTKLKKIETERKIYEDHCLQLESEFKAAKMELEEKKSEAEFLLSNSRTMTKKLEDFLELRSQNWKKKEKACLDCVTFQLSTLKGIRSSSDYIKKEVLKCQNAYFEEFTRLRLIINELEDAAERSNMVLEENRRLYNEVQELKGNIRVFCRIRPFLSNEKGKATTIDHLTDNGELFIVNPSKHGKSDNRMFKFNKVFGPEASQEKVYLDSQPLIRSVLDGFNVCIFAYGQTGAGKTYTMSGPNSPSKENMGVNYRALYDLFDLSQSRRSTLAYEIEVQIVEIYNEQVRDLLSNNTQRRLEIRNISQTNGIAVPDASLYHVKSPTDVIDLMQIAHRNRAMSATALNERSSRSHSVVTVHVRGTDLKSRTSLHGSLHLVDLAGSERVDRSEVTGDRLREAQHINKSLSALGDVIFALAQKSSHVPFRNSKLTQLLQASLGGHAKTLMFVQINPDVESYSETSSTLKFAERVSGVELGAARANKEVKDARELMDQVTFLRETIMKKDEEIDRLHVIKEVKEGSTCSNHSRHSSRVDSKTETDGSTEGSRENSEVAKAANNTNATKKRIPSTSSRVPTLQKSRSTATSRSKPKDNQKGPPLRSPSPRRTKTNHVASSSTTTTSTTSSAKSSKRWQ